MERRGYHRLHSCIPGDSHGLIFGHPLVDTRQRRRRDRRHVRIPWDCCRFHGASRVVQALSVQVSDSLGVGRRRGSRPRSVQVCCSTAYNRPLRIRLAFPLARSGGLIGQRGCLEYSGR